jgi:molecular chaperone HscC
VHPRDQQINTLLLARLDRLYQESLGDGRERIAGLANHFQQMLDTQDERLIREARGDITQRLAHFEREG